MTTDRPGPGRVAICVSGALRTFQRCAPTVVRHLARPLDADIFVHAWRQTWPPAHAATSETTVQAVYGARDVVLEDFDPVYARRMGNLEVPSELAAAEPRHHAGALPMLWKIRACNDLKRATEASTGRRYDAVVRIRPDIRLLAGLPEALLANLAPGDIWQASLMIDPVHQVSDKFVVADSRTMDVYAALFDHLAAYWSSPLGDGTWRNHRVGERLVRQYVADQNLRAQLFDIPAELDRGPSSTLHDRIARTALLTRRYLRGSRIYS